MTPELHNWFPYLPSVYHVGCRGFSHIFGVFSRVDVADSLDFSYKRYQCFSCGKHLTPGELLPQYEKTS